MNFNKSETPRIIAYYAVRYAYTTYGRNMFFAAFNTRRCLERFVTSFMAARCHDIVKEIDLVLEMLETRGLQAVGDWLLNNSHLARYS